MTGARKPDWSLYDCEKCVISTFWKSTSGNRLSFSLGKCPFSDSGPGCPGCLALQCTLWLESSWAMFRLRQLLGDLDGIYQGQVIWFKWRPGTPVSNSLENRQTRIRRKPRSPANSNSLAQDCGLHKMKSVRGLPSMGANEFPLRSSQFEMNCLPFVTRIYTLRKNYSKPIINFMLCSGTIG